MTWVLRHRCGRALGAGLLSVALLSGGTAGAFAAGSAAPSAGSAPPSPTTGMASITINVNKSAVKAGQMVKFTGRTKGLKIGTPLVLQHEKNGKWTNLKSTAKVRKGSSYELLARLNTKGTEHLRVAAGHVYSPAVTVKVS
ncbi:hypothetical protein [Streptomyces sp. NPDC007205]|uniref:hypothetical protein n=1 Tax=Streptomyces sp. NPDC007205 TaxID=3154316 RepID=UPI00340DD9F3